MKSEQYDDWVVRIETYFDSKPNARAEIIKCEFDALNKRISREIDTLMESNNEDEMISKLDKLFEFVDSANIKMDNICKK